MKILSHENIQTIKKYNNISLKGIDKKLALKLFNFMLKLRLCEEALEKEYHPADDMQCPVHFCTGEEAVPAALNQLLNQNDYLFSHHRSHGYYLSKNAPMDKLFAELYGKETGANSGLAGSQDISFPKKNFFSGAILSGATAIALGAAINLSMVKNNKNVVVAGFGDAATDEGVFWETLNYASLKKLPIVFVCENNNYSTFSPQKNRRGGKSIARKAEAFGINCDTIFGNDVSLVFRHLKKGIFNARKKRGPYLLESLTFRHSGHVGPLSDEFEGYRSKKEIKFWKDNDPVKLFESFLLKKKIINKKDITKIEELIFYEIKRCFDFAKKSKFPKIKSIEKLNISASTPLADKILKEIKEVTFDENQEVILPKGY